jgi:hypothetical protein
MEAEVKEVEVEKMTKKTHGKKKIDLRENDCG